MKLQMKDGVFIHNRSHLEIACANPTCVFEDEVCLNLFLMWKQTVETVETVENFG